jgi:hypothetical protein
MCIAVGPGGVQADDHFGRVQLLLAGQGRSRSGPKLGFIANRDAVPHRVPAACWPLWSKASIPGGQYLLLHPLKYGGGWLVNGLNNIRVVHNGKRGISGDDVQEAFKGLLPEPLPHGHYFTVQRFADTVAQIDGQSAIAQREYVGLLIQMELPTAGGGLATL